MKQLFINLPVEDLEKSAIFYNQIGFTNYPLFTDSNQKCVVWSEHILVMLQSKEFFHRGKSKPIVYAKANIALTFTLPVESLEKVNEIIERGLNAGGAEPIAKIDEGYMQVRSIEDLDGHSWSIMHLDLDKFKEFRVK